MDHDRRLASARWRCLRRPAGDAARLGSTYLKYAALSEHMKSKRSLELDASKRSLELDAHHALQVK
jgi:hypothetical protein